MQISSKTEYVVVFRKVCRYFFCLEKALYVICEDEKSTSFISYFCYFLNNSCLQWQVINFRLFTRITIYLEPIKAQSWGSSVPVSFITISYDEEVELERFGYLVHNNVSCENCEVFYLLALLRVKLIVEPNWSNINILMWLLAIANYHKKYQFW